MKAALILLAGLWTGESAPPAQELSEPVPVLFSPAPVITELAFKAGFRGEVRVDVTVLPTGAVGDAAIVGEPPPYRADEVILRSVRTWRFAPSEETERKVELVFDFQTAGECDPPPPPVERLSPYHLRIWRQKDRYPTFSIGVMPDGTTACTATVRPCPEGAGVLIDPRDGRRYSTMRVGSLEWMRENLDFASPESRCFDDKPSVCSHLGRLYPFDSARDACPQGWRLPTDEEWMELEASAGISRRQLRREEVRGKKAGESLRMWGESQLDLALAGYRSRDGSYLCYGLCTLLWSGTETSDGRVWYRKVQTWSPEKDGVWRGRIDREYALSVRCVRPVD